MFDRIAVAAVTAVLAIGGLTLGASLLTKPDHAARPCPATLREADAIDTFTPGLTQAQRAWGTRVGAPARVRPGRIAGFAADIGSGPGAVDLLDPATAERCRLVQLLANYPVQGPEITSLDWSPSGDALAIGLGGQEGPDGPENGQVLIWTQSRLLRIWYGDGTPRLEWAPDGQTLVVWSSTSTGSEAPETRLIHADGSPDRLFAVHPWVSALEWSPDGTRWVVAELVETGQDTRVSLVDVADGRVTPIAIEIDRLDVAGWLDDGRLLLAEWQWGVGDLRFLEVPTANPAAHSDVNVPGILSGWDPVLSPDRRRLAYLTGKGDVGHLAILGLSGNEPRAPLPIAPGHEVAPTGLAWSPDGTQLVLHAEGAMWIADANGTGMRQIDEGNVVVVDDPWQPVPIP